MPADPQSSSWAPFVGAALGSLVTGAALVFQSWLSDKRLRSHKAADERRALEEKRADRLLEARAGWASAYQSLYMDLRQVTGHASVGRSLVSEDIARVRERIAAVHQQASRLALVEPRAPLTRMVRMLSIHLGLRGADAVKERERIEIIYGISFSPWRD